MDIRPYLNGLITSPNPILQKRWDARNNQKYTRYIDRENAFENLQIFDKLCKKHKIPYLALFGTTLGGYRDQKIIEHDHDVDVGFYDFTASMRVFPFLVSTFEEGFQLLRVEDALISIIRKDEYIDISFFQQYKDNYYHQCSSPYLRPSVKLHLSYFLHPGIIKLYGQPFPAPANTEEYLLKEYGIHWKEPIRDFHACYDIPVLPDYGSYWERCYATQKIGPPSQFAQDTFPLMVGTSVLDYGGGVGQDSKFFLENGKKVLFYDPYSRPHLPGLGHIGPGEPVKVDNIYLRWVLHAVKIEKESEILNWAHSCLNPGGRIFIEARSNKGDIPDQSHYRRPIDSDVLFRELEYIGFTLIETKEEADLSPHPTDNPILIRAIGEKK